jgi:hypothetical protein
MSTIFPHLGLAPDHYIGDDATAFSSAELSLRFACARTDLNH